jgi:hypothetical protein
VALEEGILDPAGRAAHQRDRAAHRRPDDFFPTYRPVFTSIATSASVWLMTMYPPDLSQTLLRRALSISLCTPYSSKIG